MTIQEIDKATPNALINIRPVVAAMKEFFGGSQLSPVHGPDQPAGRADQQAPPSALGPGGLSRERAGFDVRDVHHSHYGRICPIETPGRPEHRPDRLARDLRPDQQLRLHRDALPQGQADRRLGRPEPAHVRGRRRTSWPRAAGSSSRPAQPFTAAAVGRAQEAEGPGLPDPADRHRRDRVPARRRGGAARRRPGQRAARRDRPLHRRARPVALPRTSSPRPGRARSSTWTSRRSRSSRWRPRSSRSSSTTTPTGR